MVHKSSDDHAEEALRGYHLNRQLSPFEHNPDDYRDLMIAATTDDTPAELPETQERFGTFIRRMSKEANEAPTGPVKSDGGSSTYYFLPKGATELNDLIEFKEMSFARGNIFKALYRLGNKAGTDVEYDLNKMQLFLDRMREMNRKGQRL